MRISLESEFNLAIEKLNLMPAKVQRASQQALNRVGITARKEARNLVAEEVEPKRKGDTSEAIQIERATQSSRRIVLTINEKHLPLDKVKGVRVLSFRQGNRRVQLVTYRGRRLKGAFRPTNLTQGNRAIFKQVPGKYQTGNRKVKRLYAFSILQETDKSRILKRLDPIVRRRFNIEFGRTLRRAIE